MGALDAGFWFEGVCIPAIACIGFIGNIAMIVKYVKMVCLMIKRIMTTSTYYLLLQKRKRLMDNLLLTICCFDIVSIGLVINVLILIHSSGYPLPYVLFVFLQPF